MISFIFILDILAHDSLIMTNLNLNLFTVQLKRCIRNTEVTDSNPLKPECLYF